MAERVVIAASPRAVLGKKVKQLRREGILPANVYGRGLDSAAIQLSARDFANNIKRVGIRQMFELSIDGENAPRYVVIRGLTRKGGTGDTMHVDFYQVDPNRPITANVALHLVGEAPAVRDLAGTLVHSLDLVSIFCKPLDIPDALTADVSMLTSFESTLTVGDLVAPEGIEILTDPAVAVAVVVPPRLRLEDEDEGAEAAAAGAPVSDQSEASE